MLRIGIIGCGNIFTMHATSANYLENAQIVGVCDIKRNVLTRRQKNIIAKHIMTIKN